MENGRSYEFASARDVHRHLNRWAAETLVDPDSWAAALRDASQWADYSPRNQALLASYGARGLVAGRDTWRLVEGTDGRPCVPRADEHGYPVRVPLTRPGREADPFLGGTRPTRSQVEGFEWYPVFSELQLSRPPAPDELGVQMPARVVDDDGTALFDAVVSAARSLGHRVSEPGERLRGNGIRVRDDETPDERTTRLLTTLAGRGAGVGRNPLTVAEAAQAAWLVTRRVHRAPGPMPTEFDPTLTDPRDRWERLVETLASVRSLVGRVGHALQFDLLASPLPRRVPGDDRVVRPTVRAHLPEASVRGLPTGRWVGVGPYSAAEWAARGVPGGDGRGAYLRVSPGSYLAVVEHGAGNVHWQLESVRRRAVSLAGDARTLADAKQASVRAAVTARVLGPEAPTAPTSTPTAPGPHPGAGPRVEWVQREREGSKRAFDQAVTADGVTLVVSPGPGGRWQALVIPAAEAGRTLPLTSSREEARAAAETAAVEANPARFDDQVFALTSSYGFDHTKLAPLVESRLDPPLAAELAGPDVPTDRLADLLATAGVSAMTVAAVLRAEQRPAGEVAEVLPTLGIPTVEATRFLAEGWELPVPAAGALLAATATQMREAGATPAELLGAVPREYLRTLEPDPAQWRHAANTMLTNGTTPAMVTAHLVQHSPNPECFVVAMSGVTDRFTTAVAMAASFGARATELAALSEWHAADLAETSAALTAYGIPAPVAVETLRLRCDGDVDVTVSAAVTYLGLNTASAIRALEVAHPDVVPAPGLTRDEPTGPQSVRSRGDGPERSLSR